MKILGMMLVVVLAYVLLASIVNSQNTNASTLAGFDIETGNVADLVDVVEADNATTTVSGAINETASGINMTGARFLSVQSAQSGSKSQVNATTYTLELSNVSDKTIFFSDRPDRIVTSVSTSDFVGNWTVGADNFATDPPNAALVLDDEQERQDIAIVTLFNPTYDSEANVLKFDMIPENATTSLELPTEFGQSTLVIDDVCLSCWGG